MDLSMKKFLIAAAWVALTAPVLAAEQPQNDAAFLGRAIQALQAQRNQALDAVVVQQARADGLAEELAQAQAKIKDLEAKAEPKKD